MRQSSPPTVPADRAAIIAASAAGGIGMATAMGFGRFSFTPILPGMMADLGLTPAEAGVIAAANFAGYLAGAVLASLGWAEGRERRLALLALLATAALLFAMGLGTGGSSGVLVFSVVRFLAGLSSAFAMIFMSGIVLGVGLRHGSHRVASFHFGGVGLGIALSSLMVYVLAFSGAGWRADWFAGGVFAVLATLLVARLLPKAPAVQGQAKPAEPRLTWSRPLTVMTLTYGLFGFGYVVSATFIVAMARDGGNGPSVEFLTWFVTGIAAALSVHVWRAAVPRIGLVGAYAAGMLVEAVGLVLAVVLSGGIAPILGGLLLGATFIMVTAFGLEIGRKLAPESPRRALASLTAAFGVGQIIGPAVGGALAAQAGGYGLPTLIAAGVLVIAAAVTMLHARAIRQAAGV